MVSEVEYSEVMNCIKEINLH